MKRIASPTVGRGRTSSADEGPNFSEFQMCGATDNRAAQTSLTLTLSPLGARESEKKRAGRFWRPALFARCEIRLGGLLGFDCEALFGD
jgi:hypothetical protein